MAFVHSHAQRVSITVAVSGVATHPEDDLVLATAISAGADYLVTGDRRFRTRIPRYRSVLLLSPAEFLAVLPAPYDAP
jgi:predicted nucleic acid-binding protein